MEKWYPFQQVVLGQLGYTHNEWSWTPASHHIKKTHKNRVKEKDKPNSYSMRQPTDGKTKFGMCLYGEDLLDTMKKRIAIIINPHELK